MSVSALLDLYVIPGHEAAFDEGVREARGTEESGSLEAFRGEIRAVLLARAPTMGEIGRVLGPDSPVGRMLARHTNYDAAAWRDHLVLDVRSAAVGPVMGDNAEPPGSLVPHPSVHDVTRLR